MNNMIINNFYCIQRKIEKESGTVPSFFHCYYSIWRIVNILIANSICCAYYLAWFLVHFAAKQTDS